MSDDTKKSGRISPSELSHRTKRILHAVVSEYLQTGEAVGSRTVTRRHGIELSPATVRNVMSDLEDIGLLDQPHTSAGRVPTQSGLRFFIDCLLKVRSLSPKEKEEIRAKCGVDALAIERLMQQTSRTLSEVTRCAGIVLAPNPARQKLRHIEFMPLAANEFLCIIVTSEGHVENKLIKTEAKVDLTRLDAIHNYLNELLGGLALDEVRKRVLLELGRDKNRLDALISSALQLSKQVVETERDSKLIVSGSSNLLVGVSAEDQLSTRAELLRALEDKEILSSLLDKAMSADQLQVFLGAETELAPLGSASVVAVPYGPEERPIGALAVVGPTRMNYGRVMSVVDFTAKVVSMLMADE